MKHMCEMGVTRGPVDVTGRSGAQSAMTLTPNVGILWVTLSILDRVLQDGLGFGLEAYVKSSWPLA